MWAHRFGYHFLTKKCAPKPEPEFCSVITQSPGQIKNILGRYYELIHLIPGFANVPDQKCFDTRWVSNRDFRLFWQCPRYELE